MPTYKKKRRKRRRNHAQKIFPLSDGLRELQQVELRGSVLSSRRGAAAGRSGNWQEYVCPLSRWLEMLEKKNDDLQRKLMVSNGKRSASVVPQVHPPFSSTVNWKSSTRIAGESTVGAVASSGHTPPVCDNASMVKFKVSEHILHSKSTSGFSVLNYEKAKVSWRSLCKNSHPNSKDGALQYLEPTIINGRKVACISRVEIEEHATQL